MSVQRLVIIVLILIVLHAQVLMNALTVFLLSTPTSMKAWCFLLTAQSFNVLIVVHLALSMTMTGALNVTKIVQPVLLPHGARIARAATNGTKVSVDLFTKVNKAIS